MVARRRNPENIECLSPLAAFRSVAIGPLAAIFRAPFGPRCGSGCRRTRPPPPRHQRLFSMFVTPAYAQAPSLFGGGDHMLVSLLPFILIFVIMYFLILRPQQKRQKQHQEMVKNVRRGDTVITNGGLITESPRR